MFMSFVHRSNILTWNIGQVCMHPDEHPNNTNSSFGIADMDAFEFSSGECLCSEVKRDVMQINNNTLSQLWRRRHCWATSPWSTRLAKFRFGRCSPHLVFFPVSLPPLFQSPFEFEDVHCFLSQLPSSLGLAMCLCSAPFKDSLSLPPFLSLEHLHPNGFILSRSFEEKWSKCLQNGLFVSALVANVQLAPAITNPTSGLLCRFIGWPSIFYAHGAIGTLLFITYGLFYRNSPKKCVFVSETELNKISVGKETVEYVRSKSAKSYL